MASKKRTRNAGKKKEGETAETLTFVRIDFSARPTHSQASNLGFRTNLEENVPNDLASLVLGRLSPYRRIDEDTRTKHIGFDRRKKYEM